MLARIVRILLAAALACLAAGVIHELFMQGGVRQELSLQRIVDTAITSAWWAAPFAAAGLLVTEWLKLRHALVYLLGGLVIAVAAALMHREGGVPELASLLKLPKLTALLSMGTLGGLVYWLLQGHRAGWRGDAAEAALANSRASVMGVFDRERKPRCWPCLFFGGLLAALPLLFLGWMAIEKPDLDANIQTKTVVEANAALKDAGYPWASLRIDGYQGHIEGRAPNEADRDKAFAAAQTYLAPAVGMPGVIGVLRNGITTPSMPTTVATVVPPAAPAVRAPVIAAPAVASPPVAVPAPLPKPSAAEIAKNEETIRRLAAETEAKRLAEAAEAKRIADAAAEAKRVADAAETKRIADAAVEAKRAADAAEAKRIADAAAETKRLADAAEAKRIADAAAEAKRTADAAEAKRLFDIADAKRRADLAEAKRLEDAEAAVKAAEAKRKADEAARTTVVVRQPPPPVVPTPAPAASTGCDADAVAAIESARLQFDTASSDIGAPDKTEIARIADGLKRCSSMKVVINGHTDDVGAEGYNASLSQRRADIIRTELAAMGIGADRMTVRGFGGTRPILPNSSEQGRATNRRVEFTLDGGLDLNAPANAQRAATCRTDFTRLLTAGGIVFEPSSAIIAAVSNARLDEVAAAAKGCSAFGLLVEGHADKTGNPNWNIRISDLRAKAVRDALVARGVPAARLDAKGFGSSRLLDPSDTKEAHAKNRRIEISIGNVTARTN